MGLRRLTNSVVGVILSRMTKSEALTLFRTRRALARALGLADHSINRWEGDSIPPIHQVRLERLTNYQLRADPGAWAPAPETFSEDHLSMFTKARRMLSRLMGATE